MKKNKIFQGPSKEEIFQDIESKDIDCSVMLLDCAKHNFLEGVKYLVEEKNCKIEWGHIEEAGTHGNLNVVKYLYKKFRGHITFHEAHDTFRHIFLDLLRLHLHKKSDKKRKNNMIQANKFLLDNLPEDISKELINDHRNMPLFRREFKEYL